MKQILSAITAVTILITTGFAQKPIDLKFNLKKGENYNYNLSMNIETKGNFGGQDIDVKNNVGIGYLFTSLGDSAEWTKLSATVARLSMNMNVANMDISYDSDKPEDTTNSVNGVLGKVLGAMKGGQFQLTINKSGVVGSVSGFDNMMQKVTSAAANAGQLGSTANAFSEENFRQNLQQTFGAYPTKPVKPGDTWTGTVSATNSGVEMKTESVYTLESVDGNTANVKVDAKLVTPDTTAATTVNGTSTGTIQYDIPSGIAIGGDIDTNLKMTISQQGQTIPMTTDMKMKIEGKKS